MANKENKKGAVGVLAFGFDHSSSNGEIELKLEGSKGRKF